MPDTRETNGNLLGIHGYPALLSTAVPLIDFLIIKKGQTESWIVDNKHFGLSGRHPDPKTGFFFFF